jgi:CheY-like chemotaxis protein
VEDDPSSSDVLARAIRRRGGESVVAATVGQALLRIEQEWPNAVILDLRLPDADGTVLLRRLRRDKRKTHVAVVTGVPDLSGYVELMHFPPDVLLHKPVNMETLLRWLWRARAEFEQATGKEVEPWLSPSALADISAAAATAADPAAAIGATDAGTGVPGQTRRREDRFPSGRAVLIRAANVDAAAARDARLLDCSARGVSIAQAEPLPLGQWFSLAVNADSPSDTTTAMYAVRNCTRLPDGQHRIGAELVGFVSGPGDDPDTLLRALRTKGTG